MTEVFRNKARKLSVSRSHLSQERIFAKSLHQKTVYTELADLSQHQKTVYTELAALSQHQITVFTELATISQHQISFLFY